MAADSGCFDGDTHVGSNKKIWRVGKCLIGFAGNIASCLNFVQWYKSGADEESIYPWGDDIEALVVFPDGSMRTYYGNSMEPIVFSSREKYIAIGSGMDVALGCLFQGGSAVDSIRAAIKHNVNSKGPVRSYRLKG